MKTIHFEDAPMAAEMTINIHNITKTGLINRGGV